MVIEIVIIAADEEEEDRRKIFVTVASVAAVSITSSPTATANQIEAVEAAEDPTEVVLALRRIPEAEVTTTTVRTPTQSRPR